MTRTLILLRVAAATLLFTLSAAAAAGKDPVYTSMFSNTALKGYDAVAYFSEGEDEDTEKKRGR